MPQILVSPESIQDNRFTISGSEAHHLARVLRAKAGDEIHLFDGKGRRYKAKIVKVNPGPAIDAEITGEISGKTRAHQIHLYQGVPRGAKMDYVIEKAVELGADAIIPFLSEKNIVKLDDKQATAKAKRWQALAKAAASQCNRADVPLIDPPRRLKDLGPSLSKALTLFLWEKEKSRSLRSTLRVTASSSALINILIGPESGFSAREAEGLIEGGALPVSLGERILRTETAGLAALSIVNYELGLF